MGSSQKQMIGSISEYNSQLDDWNVYYERLEQFFEVNDVPDEKRSAFLISVIGSEAYKSLRDLCNPALPKDKPFEFLCELLRKQFSPQISIFRERVKFYNTKQEPYENVTQWYGKLKRLSVDCKFAGNLESVLLDKFITGLRPGQVLDRLCEESETLKLEQALDIAVNKECAAKENAYVPFVPAPRVTKCYFGGEPVRARPAICPPTLAVCPPAPVESAFKTQAFGFPAAREPAAFGGGFGGSTTFGAPQALGAAPQAATGLFGGTTFGAAPAVAAAPQAALFRRAPANCAPESPILAQEEAICAESAVVAEKSVQPEQQDGVPEGANRASGPAAKGRRVRTRRRGGARRGAAGDAGDQNSVDGE